MSISQWAIGGNNAGYAIPLSSATPTDPNTQAYTLAWDPVNQYLSWVPVAIGATSGDVAPAGNLNLLGTKKLQVGGLQVVSARRTGWVAPTGAVSRATFDPATVTLAQLGAIVAALETDITAHGLIGA